MPERILLIRLAALGDVATTSVLLNRIRAEAPDAEVTWVCGRGIAPLVALVGADRVVSLDDRLLHGGLLGRATALLTSWISLAGLGRFDRVLLVHADWRYRLLVLPVRRRSLRALRWGRGGDANPIQGRYLGDEYARLFGGVGDAGGPIERRYPVSDVRSRLPRRERATSAGRRVVLVPGGARNVLRDDALRRWPVENYRALADALRGDGFDVVLVGDAGDAWVRPTFQGADVDDQIGRLDIAGTLALMAEANVVVSHDTGPLHLARLVRAPLVAIFGPTAPHHVMRDDEAAIILWGGERLACRPCYDGVAFAACETNLCMRATSVARVLEAVNTLAAAPPVPGSIPRVRDEVMS